MNQQVRTATAERERLKTIKEIVDRLELERQRLAARLDVLSNLKNNLRTPLYPVFFLYLAQQNRPGVVFEEFVAREENEERITYYTLKGESSNEELNRLMEDLGPGSDSGGGGHGELGGRQVRDLDRLQTAQHDRGVA